MRFWRLLWIVLLLIAPDARAEWAAVSTSLPESDIRWVIVDPSDFRTIYAASARRIYRSVDSGATWNQVCTVWNENDSARFLYADPVDKGAVYVASDSGVWRSTDFGETWKSFYQGVGGLSKSVRCIARDASDPKKLWLGTSRGLVAVDVVSARAVRVGGFPSSAVEAIWVDPKKRGIHIAASDGLYVGEDAGLHWKKIAQTPSSAEESEELTAQLNEDEQAMAASAAIVHPEALGRFFAASSSDLYDSPDDRISWKRAGGPARGLKINYLAQSPQTFYAATNRGVYRWQPSRLAFEDISAGLPSRSVSMVSYDTASGALMAATRKGIYRLSSPELPVSVKPVSGAASATFQDAEEVLRLFDREPSIGEVQKAAVEYAEVHPRKIRQWREAAARKAWLPTVSIHQGFDRDENIDLDRGGTTDPDKFIQGPAEKSYDWSVSASWDLGELVWNDDQTSIDTRSRLLVELRNDVLNEVTHLYFERRRLQAELALRAPANLAAQVEKRLRFQELTADIDALTGGFLSSHLNQTGPTALSK